MYPRKLGAILLVVGIMIFLSSAFGSGSIALFLQLFGFGLKGFGAGLIVSTLPKNNHR
jgi:hypothetical protein